jgi:Rv0078B-related antitoxin
VSEGGRPVVASRIERLDPEVARVLRGKSGMERLRLAHEAWELTRDRLTAFLIARHPDWSPERIRHEVATRLSR